MNIRRRFAKCVYIPDSLCGDAERVIAELFEIENFRNGHTAYRSTKDLVQDLEMFATSEYSGDYYDEVENLSKNFDKLMWDSSTLEDTFEYLYEKYGDKTVSKARDWLDDLEKFLIELVEYLEQNLLPPEKLYFL